MLHKESWKRWANRKLGMKLRKSNKCVVVSHIRENEHPTDKQYGFPRIFAIELVHNPSHLLRREVWWHTNVGTLFTEIQLQKQRSVCDACRDTTGSNSEPDDS